MGNGMMANSKYVQGSGVWSPESRDDYRRPEWNQNETGVIGVPLQSPKMMGDPEMNIYKTRGYLRSAKLWLTNSTTLDTGNEVPMPVDYDIVNQRNHLHHHHRWSTQNSGPRHHSSTLTSLDGAGEQQSSSIWPLIKGLMSESPLDGEDLVRSDVDHDQHWQLQQLGKDAHLANKHRKRAWDELRSETMCSPLNSKSTSSPDSIQRELLNHDSDVEQITATLEYLMKTSNKQCVNSIHLHVGRMKCTASIILALPQAWGYTSRKEK